MFFLFKTGFQGLCRFYLPSYFGLQFYYICNLKINPNMKYILSALVLTLFMSCSKDKETDYVAQNEKEISAYLEKNNLTAQRSDSGLYYIINNSGTGVKPTANATVKVAYKGYFTDGSVFDESSAEGISFGLQQVIRGWTEGIPYFKEGGNGILLVPSHLGYGSNDSRSIPGGSVLIFEVKLIKVY
ncbi:MAG: FKBP-type peptidyl-prolyl cis-trans isomerase FkpA [Flavobacterium sp.]|jgi:FKBP-type peptidyl-prolyl cis-trans isomerase FkpA